MTARMYQFRTATVNDIGRLARFADRHGDDWSYGLLTGAISVCGEQWFSRTQQDCDEPDNFFICEVEELSEGTQ